jgi:hypothetical protein
MPLKRQWNAGTPFFNNSVKSRVGLYVCNAVKIKKMNYPIAIALTYAYTIPYGPRDEKG